MKRSESILEQVQHLYENKRDTQQALIVRINASQGFRASARLREFLSYVADCEFRNAPQEATEQQIGVHVFGRKAGYNSSEDSIVRSHARLLRQKLSEYFATEGIHEQVLVLIPKGHYLPVFQPREEERPTPESVIELPELPVLPVTPKPDFPLTETSTDLTPFPVRVRPLNTRRSYLVPLVVSLVLIAVLAGGWITLHQHPCKSLVGQFWAPFMATDSSLVIYSNALFTGDSVHGLRYATSDAHSDEKPEDMVGTYTGTGELAGVYELTRLFDVHHASFTLKRSLLVTWDQARLQNLIFVGSVAENTSLRDVPSTTDFILTRGEGYSAVLNRRPAAGEQTLYSVPLRSTTEDYAILAYLPGEQAGRHMLVYSGLTTIGTQAAVDFTCQADGFQQLLEHVRDSNGQIRSFEAVLETAIVGGVPLRTRLVALHTH